MDPITYVADALFATLRENMPAHLATLDADRADKLPLSTPDTQFFTRPLIGTDSDVTTPIVTLERKSARQGQRYTTGEVLVSLRLGVFFPGPAGDETATHEAVSALAAAVYDVVRSGDGRGAYMVGGADATALSVCRPRPYQVEPRTKMLDRRGSSFPFGIAYPEFEIQVWI